MRSIKTFFPQKFKGKFLKEQKVVLLNSIKLYDDRSKIIKLFEDKNIMPINSPYDQKSEPEPIPEF